MATYWWLAKTNANYSDVSCDGATGVSFVTAFDEGMQVNVATITSNAHGLTDKWYIEISSSSDTNALPNGSYSIVTIVNENQFQIAGFSDIPGTGSGTATWKTYVWYQNESGAVGGGLHTTKPTASDDVYFSSTASTFNCTLTGNEACNSLSTRTDETGGTDNWKGTLNISTFDFVVTGAIRIYGIDASNKSTLQIGVSASNGLVCNGLYFGNYANFTLASGVQSIVKNSGEHICAPVQIWTTSNRGAYYSTSTTPKIYQGGNFNNVWAYFEDNVDSDLQLSGQSYLTGASSAGGFKLLGKIRSSGGTVSLGGGSSSIAYFGADCDLIATDSPLWRMQTRKGATITMLKTTPFTLGGGTLQWFSPGSAGANIMIFSMDWSNVDSVINTNGGAGNIWEFTAGTYKAKSFLVQNSPDASDMSVLNNVNNANIEIYNGQFNLRSGTAGTWITTYTKGTGTITLGGNTGSHTLKRAGNATEVITVTGATYNSNDAFTDTTFNVTGGRFNFLSGATTTITNLTVSNATIGAVTSGTRATLAVTNQNFTNVSFKDLSFGSARQVNGKSHINLGNNLGIVFKDRCKSYQVIT